MKPIGPKMWLTKGQPKLRTNRLLDFVTKVADYSTGTIKVWFTFKNQYSLCLGWFDEDVSIEARERIVINMLERLALAENRR